MADIFDEALASLPPRVRELPCPKCGGADIHMRYRAASEWHGCSARGREHFHRSCRRCGYDWTTLDVLDVAESGHVG